MIDHFRQGGPLAPGLGLPRALFCVVWLWIADLATGMRGAGRIACADMLFSGSVYVSGVFALGLYDAARVGTRKLKPQFRRLYRMGFAVLLSLIVVLDGLGGLSSRRQYSMDVVLALAFALLIYSNPVVAICVDHLLTWGSPVVIEAHEQCDEGDIV